MTLCQVLFYNKCDLNKLGRCHLPEHPPLDGVGIILDGDAVELVPLDARRVEQAPDGVYIHEMLDVDKTLWRRSLEVDDFVP